MCAAKYARFFIFRFLCFRSALWARSCSLKNCRGEILVYWILSHSYSSKFSTFPIMKNIKIKNIKKKKRPSIQLSFLILNDLYQP